MVSAFQIGLILAVSLGSLTYGYCSSIISTTLGQPSFLSYMGLDTASNATQLEGATNALFQVGGLFGSISSLWIPDKIGRRWALFIGGTFSLVGGALQTGSVDVAMFIVARFITGIGVGALVGLVPLYQSEVSPTNLRGFLVGLHGVMICVGYTSASWIGVGFYFVHGGNQWRGPLGFQMCWPLGLMIALPFVPESPRWLLAKGRKDDAFKAFRTVHDSGVKVKDGQHEIAVREEFRLLAAQTAQEMKDDVPLSAFFTRPNLFKRCVIGFGVMFAAQGTFTLVINNYGPILYKGLGFSTVDQLLIQAGWISVCPGGNVINALIVDKIGRTRLLMFGFAGTVTALVGACATVVVYNNHGQSRSVAAAAVFFLFWHIACFCVSVDATSYIYASELFPTPLRARGIGISISGLFIATIIFLQAAPTAFAHINGYYYLVGTFVTIFFFFVAWFYWPETKGRSLEDIAEIFGDNITLDDAEEEAIHKRFREGHYQEKAIAQAADEIRHHRENDFPIDTNDVSAEVKSL
ncbi:hypothetical protein Z517_08215 [Fonsecaea pedrosoi CBS 271.37]|uniref:Major facilitator superfamily (MFS) profile domain-containing protein n=1 Tax=Fonsecaea pedrosoi CBS 271.37 TaxID=1442368 RepID=A0A0D2GII9_9EURO|nr:uncharacterized protein Z517_08215 [Fonsecaea pedrosoi CBS 271.37]KIW78380.1 hypothetical protein Z517_08215 [Fonsecaea pedrosoi CBS 271.37]